VCVCVCVCSRSPSPRAEFDSRTDTALSVVLGLMALIFFLVFIYLGFMVQLLLDQSVPMHTHIVKLLSRVKSLTFTARADGHTVFMITIGSPPLLLPLATCS